MSCLTEHQEDSLRYLKFYFHPSLYIKLVETKVSCGKISFYALSISIMFYNKVTDTFKYISITKNIALLSLFLLF